MKRISLALFVLLASCARLLPHERSVAHPGGYQRTITDRSAAKAQITEGPIANVPRVLDVLFRVRPDRRFVNAVADIRELSGGRKIDDVLRRGGFCVQEVLTTVAHAASLQAGLDDAVARAAACR